MQTVPAKQRPKSPRQTGTSVKMCVVARSTTGHGQFHDRWASSWMWSPLLRVERSSDGRSKVGAMTTPAIGSMPIANPRKMFSADVTQGAPDSIDEVGMQLPAMVQIGAETFLINWFADVVSLHEVDLVCIDGVGVAPHNLFGDDFRALDTIEKGSPFICNMAAVGSRICHAASHTT